MNIRSASRRIKSYLFENKSLRQTVFKNTFWLGMSNVVGRLIRSGLIIYAARILGTEGYGVFSYALGLSAFFSLFSDIGVSGILTREVSKHPESLKEFVATSLVIKVILLVFSLGIIIAAGPFISNIPQALPLLPFAALLLTFDGFRDFILSISRALERMEIEGMSGIVTNLAIALIGFVILYIRPTPRSLIAGYTLGSGIGMLVAFWVLREHFRSPHRYFKKELLKPILIEAFPFALMGILGTLMLNTDTVMIGWLKDVKAVGLYSAAQRPVQVLYTIPTFLSGALFPAFARLAMDKSDRFSKILERAIAFSFLLAFPLVIGGVALSQGIVHLLFGSAYTGATASFMILLFTILINFPSGFIGNAVFAHGEQKSFIGSLAFGAVGNVLFNYLFIPRWGIVGSCLSTIIALFLSQGFLWWRLKKLREFSIFPHLTRIIPASILMGSAVFALAHFGISVIFNMALGAVLYAALLYFFREPLLQYIPRPSRGA